MTVNRNGAQKSQIALTLPDAFGGPFSGFKVGSLDLSHHDRSSLLPAMIRPRWQGLQARQRARAWKRWDQVVAVIAAMNLIWVLLDLSYIPLRNFWLQRNLYPVPSLPIVVPMPWLPDITPLLDPLKGIEPHEDTQAYLVGFRRLDRALTADDKITPKTQNLLQEQLALTDQLIATNPFASSGNAGALEKLKNRLRARTGLGSARAAAALLLSENYLCLLYTSDAADD